MAGGPRGVRGGVRALRAGHGTDAELLPATVGGPRAPALDRAVDRRDGDGAGVPRADGRLGGLAGTALPTGRTGPAPPDPLAGAGQPARAAHPGAELAGRSHRRGDRRCSWSPCWSCSPRCTSSFRSPSRSPSSATTCTRWTGPSWPRPSYGFVGVGSWGSSPRSRRRRAWSRPEPRPRWPCWSRPSSPCSSARSARGWWARWGTGSTLTGRGRPRPWRRCSTRSARGRPCRAARTRAPHRAPGPCCGRLRRPRRHPLRRPRRTPGPRGPRLGTGRAGGPPGRGACGRRRVRRGCSRRSPARPRCWSRPVDSGSSCPRRCGRSRPAGAGWCGPGTRSDVGSNSTCTTAPSSASCRWACPCALRSGTSATARSTSTTCSTDGCRARHGRGRAAPDRARPSPQQPRRRAGSGTGEPQPEHPAPGGPGPAGGPDLPGPHQHHRLLRRLRGGRERGQACRRRRHRHVGAPRRRGPCWVSVSDDGCGGAVARPGSGLAGLRDRVGALGGTLGIRSTPGTGTVVEAVLRANPDRRGLRPLPRGAVPAARRRRPRGRGRPRRRDRRSSTRSNARHPTWWCSTSGCRPTSPTTGLAPRGGPCVVPRAGHRAAVATRRDPPLGRAGRRPAGSATCSRTGCSTSTTSSTPSTGSPQAGRRSTPRSSSAARRPAASRSGWTPHPARAGGPGPDGRGPHERWASRAGSGSPSGPSRPTSATSWPNSAWRQRPGDHRRVLVVLAYLKAHAPR